MWGVGCGVRCCVDMLRSVQHNTCSTHRRGSCSKKRRPPPPCASCPAPWRRMSPAAGGGGSCSGSASAPAAAARWGASCWRGCPASYCNTFCTSQRGPSRRGCTLDEGLRLRLRLDLVVPPSFAVGKGCVLFHAAKAWLALCVPCYFCTRVGAAALLICVCAALPAGTGLGIVSDVASFLLTAKGQHSATAQLHPRAQGPAGAAVGRKSPQTKRSSDHLHLGIYRKRWLELTWAHQCHDRGPAFNTPCSRQQQVAPATTLLASTAAAPPAASTAPHVHDGSSAA